MQKFSSWCTDLAFVYDDGHDRHITFSYLFLSIKFFASMAAVASDVLGVVGGSLNILFTVVNGIQQTQNLRLEKKKLNLEIKKILLETIQASNVANVMKCYTTFEVLASKSGFIPISNNKLIKQLGVDKEAWKKIDQNNDGHIEMNEWIVFWYELEKATSNCQFCKEPKFETCFICMRSFCAEHYEFEKTSQERLCSDCIKRHRNDPTDLQQAVITKKKEMKEFEKEKIILQNKKHRWYKWSKSMPKKTKCAFDDCNYIAILNCYYCYQKCCSRCLSERAQSHKNCCRNCFIGQKRKKCYNALSCSNISNYTCGNRNCHYYTCGKCASLYFPTIELNGVKFELPVAICGICENVRKRTNQNLTVRFHLEYMTEKMLDCWSFTFCRCCFLSVEGQSYWICDDCDDSAVICENCKELEVNFGEHVSSKHLCSHYDKEGNISNKLTPKPQPTKPLDNWNGGNCSTCSKKLERAAKSYFCKACDCKMCNFCYESNCFPKSSKHSVSHDVALNIGGKEIDIFKGSIEHKTESVNNESGSSSHGAQKGRSGISQCRGLFDFDSDDPEGLPFKQGDIITVLQKDPSGWWQGELNGRIGIFPSGEWVEELGIESGVKQVLYDNEVGCGRTCSATKTNSIIRKCEGCSAGVQYKKSYWVCGKCDSCYLCTNCFGSKYETDTHSSKHMMILIQSMDSTKIALFDGNSVTYINNEKTKISQEKIESNDSSRGMSFTPTSSPNGQCGTSSPTTPSYACLGSQPGSSSYGHYSAQQGSATPSSYANLGSSVGSPTPSSYANLGSSVGSSTPSSYANLGSSVGSSTPSSYTNLGSSVGSSSYANLGSSAGSSTPSSYANLGSSVGSSSYANLGSAVGSSTSSSYANLGSSVGSSSYANLGSSVGSATPSSYANLGSSVGSPTPSSYANLGSSVGSSSYGNLGSSAGSATPSSYANLGSSVGSSSYGNLGSSVGSATPSSYANLGSSVGSPSYANLGSSVGSSSYANLGSSAGSVRSCGSQTQTPHYGQYGKY